MGNVLRNDFLLGSALPLGKEWIAACSGLRACRLQHFNVTAVSFAFGWHQGSSEGHDCNQAQRKFCLIRPGPDTT